MVGTNVLDFYDIFVNELSGSVLVFLFLSIILIAYGCSKARFPNSVTLGIIAVWMILMSLYFTFLLPLTLLFIGLFIGWMLIKIPTR